MREQLSSAELLEILEMSGAIVLADQAHGVMLAVRRRLIFLRRANVVGRAELRDALHAAGIGPGGFDRMLAVVRGQAPTDGRESPWSTAS